MQALDLISQASKLSAIFVLISENIIVSVLFLIGLFLSTACYLLVLGISFIGLSYLLLYVGAVSILFLFILMLMNAVYKILTWVEALIRLLAIILKQYLILFLTSFLVSTRLGRKVTETIKNYSNLFYCSHGMNSNYCIWSIYIYSTLFSIVVYTNDPLYYIVFVAFTTSILIVVYILFIDT